MPVPGSRTRLPQTDYDISALAAADTINTFPEKTLLAYADHGKADAELAAQLQRERVQAFANSWHALLDCLARKSVAMNPSV
ncbi:transaldolase [Marinobacterium lutimaris]|uniref:Transaldolase n=1 Tax=Marinobacterium lutimaris TaxID=568106 RepID=A0A1H6DTP7_9GAMM|nr:transaldolase [Marinobacterium lutimaris]